MPSPPGPPDAPFAASDQGNLFGEFAAHHESAGTSGAAAHEPTPGAAKARGAPRPSAEAPPNSPRSPRAARGVIGPAGASPKLTQLALTLPPALRLGTSSWSFPGWRGLVWDEADYSAASLSKKGLTAYSAHPLMHTVCVDRNFYRPMTAMAFAAHAAQVPADFRFMVKAPALVADALLRADNGQGTAPNPSFLDPVLACSQFVEPALAGLGTRTGALVFQLSPLPPRWRTRMPELLSRLDKMLSALPNVRAQAPDAVVAVEVRDPEWLTPDLVQVLRQHGATYALGLHPKLPPIAEQLPLLRALWPGPLVCRWNLNLRHGAFGYETARAQYEPFDRLQDPDPDTRAALARVIAGTVQHGQSAHIAVSNKAEGCAPLTVAALAESVATLLPAG